MKTELAIIRRKITDLINKCDNLDDEAIQEEIDDIIELLSVIVD